MKKTTAILLGTLIASSAALAQSNVLSRNAVGYIKRTVPSGGLDLMTVPFNSLEGVDNTVDSVFASASNLTQVSLWDSSSQTYRTFQKSKGTWGTAGTNVITSGVGIFVRSPSGVSQDLYLMGEVPDSSTKPSASVSVVEGVNSLGLGYPVSSSWTNLALSTSLPNLSQISVWDGSNYVTIQKSKGTWGTAGNSLQIDPGQGFFVRQPSGSGSLNWIEVKTNFYKWP